MRRVFGGAPVPHPATFGRWLSCAEPVLSPLLDQLPVDGHQHGRVPRSTRRWTSARSSASGRHQNQRAITTSFLPTGGFNQLPQKSFAAVGGSAPSNREAVEGVPEERAHTRSLDDLRHRSSEVRIKGADITTASDEPTGDRAARCAGRESTDP